MTVGPETHLDMEAAARTDCTAFWRGLRGDWTQDWVDAYWAGRHDAHRVDLRETILRFSPTSVYEFGCHCGPNLWQCESAGILTLAGCDINAPAVEQGRVHLPHADLTVGSVPTATAQYPDRAFDVVFSCFALAYTAPVILRITLAELWRLTGRALVLLEPMAADGKGPQLLGDGHDYLEWRHDYFFFLSMMVGVQAATFRRTVYETSALNGLLTIERA